MNIQQLLSNTPETTSAHQFQNPRMKVADHLTPTRDLCNGLTATFFNDLFTRLEIAPSISPEIKEKVWRQIAPDFVKATDHIFLTTYSHLMLKDFSDTEIDDMLKSIHESGIIQDPMHQLKISQSLLANTLELLQTTSKISLQNFELHRPITLAVLEKELLVPAV